MRIDIIACVPELLSSFLSHSILKRAQDKKLLEVHVHDLRDFGIGNYKQIDDYQYGGGAGMVLKPEPLGQQIDKLKSERDYDEIIYLTPDGETLNQSIANQLSLHTSLLFVAGHYKGVDERIRELYITKEISIGDYVLSGGETAAVVLVDAIGRLIPGVLNDETSALTDSFQDGFLSPPIYTRPAEYKGIKVPDILLSGHQAKIDEWRHDQALKKTEERRPDLLKDD